MKPAQQRRLQRRQAPLANSRGFSKAPATVLRFQRGGLSTTERLLRFAKEGRCTCKASAPELESQPLPSDVPDARQGQVVHAGNGLAVVDHLDVGAPIGATVRFGTGAVGMLLWSQSTGECYVAVTSGASNVTVGQTAHCVILGIKAKLEDEVVLDFEMLEVPVGDHVQGCVVDFMCNVQERIAGAQSNQLEASPSDRPHLPLLNEQGVDVVAPLARGCSMLLAGPDTEQQRATMLAMLANQAASGVHAIYAAAGRPSSVVRHAAETLQAAGAMAQGTIVATDPDATLGAQYATLCAAVALGEDIRDRGGHALVALDSMECAVRLWDSISDEAGSSSGSTDSDDSTMVELNGMLVSASAAQRRQFFSALIQRASKKRKALGGGSLTLLLALPGVPAKGERTVAGAAALTGADDAAISMDNYRHLSEDLKAKLAAALADKAKQQRDVGAAGHTRTEMIEELMSISDGQIVLAGAAEGALASIDIERSLSRMGVRAYYPAIRDYGPKARLELTQVSDAARFAGRTLDAAQQRSGQRAHLLQSLMQQAPGERTCLSELACMLCALNNGKLDGCTAESVQANWQDVWAKVQERAPDAVRHVEDTKLLVAESRKAILDACCA